MVAAHVDTLPWACWGGGSVSTPSAAVTSSKAFLRGHHTQGTKQAQREARSIDRIHEAGVQQSDRSFAFVNRTSKNGGSTRYCCTLV